MKGGTYVCIFQSYNDKKFVLELIALIYFVEPAKSYRSFL